MRALLLLALALPALADNPRGRFQRFCERGEQGRSSRGFDCVSLAFFEAFPSSGAGVTGGACTTTAPTGAKGEALTFTRAGTATCQKSAADTGIAVGDVVALSANQPRVESIGGFLAFLRESARTNNCPRSEEIDNAAWADEIFGAGVAPVVTANFALSPRNDLTADRVQFSATSGSDESMRFMGGACGAPCAVTVYVRGNGTSGTLDLCGGTTGCGSCSYVAGSFTRCTVIGVAGALLVGNGSRYNGGVARAANDVILWGFQSETANYATSYIPTTSAAASRVADSAMTATLSAAVGPTFSLGATSAVLSSTIGTSVFAQLGSIAPDLAAVGRTSDAVARFTINAATTVPTVPSAGVTMHRACMVDQGAETAWWDGSTVSAPPDAMSAGVTLLTFGAVDTYTAGVLVDLSPLRCP